MNEFIVTPYSVVGKVNYDKLVKQFGLSLIDDRLIEELNFPHKLLLFKYFFAHRDLDKIIRIYKENGKFAIVSGRGASEHIHLAHVLLFKFVLELQRRFNAFLFVPISEDEKYFAKQGLSFNDARKYAIENLIDIIALGLDKKDTEVLIDTLTMNAKIYGLAAKLAKKITLSTIKAVYGFSNEQNIGLHFFPAIQAAHILYPTVEKDLPSLVVISVDQDPHMRIARDVAAKFSLFKPAALESRFLKGLTGEEKMSASEPYSAIYVNDTPELVKRKIWKAFTGGRPTVEEQRRYGGKPDICPVYEYHVLFFDTLEEAKKRHARCRNGDLLCGDCKIELTERIIKFLKEHKAKREKAVDKIHEFADIKEFQQ
ncbi:MAG: tryptophan--tRNA ligase [Candidatus Odinarchaeota archaeon]|nr:tryptophan--tRNA ligase [Candidatus Odinarchaeota archaeon]